MRYAREREREREGWGVAHGGSGVVVDTYTYARVCLCVIVLHNNRDDHRGRDDQRSCKYILTYTQVIRECYRVRCYRSTKLTTGYYHQSNTRARVCVYVRVSACACVYNSRVIDTRRTSGGGAGRKRELERNLVVLVVAKIRKAANKTTSVDGGS